MKSYDLITYEGLSPASARKALNIFQATILGDPDHPYNVGQHPQHEDFVRIFRGLNAVIWQGEDDAQAARNEVELAEALGEDADLTPAECIMRADALLKTPGYITSEPGVLLLEKDRENIRRRVHALHILAERTGAPNPDMDPDTEDDFDDDDDL